MTGNAPSHAGTEEKSIGEPQSHPIRGEDTSIGGKKSHGIVKAWHKVSSLLSVEEQGNEPIPVDQKTDRRYWKLFTLWFSMNFNLISLSTGMSGPLVFGLSLRDSALVTIFFGLSTSFFAPYFLIFGARLGLRQMIHTRYAFGYYLAALPIVLNMCGLMGYGILGSILGGQALSAINPSALSVNSGIVIIAIIDFVLIFLGSRWIHRFDMFAWIPSFMAVMVALGCGGKHLHKQAEHPTATAASILGFAAVHAGFFIPWSTLGSDFTTYFRQDSKMTSIFAPAYAGLTGSALPLIILGSAIGGAVPNVPSWEQGYISGGVGGVFAAMLEQTGGFGKFLLVLLAFSGLGNMVGSIYALSLNWQNVFYLARIRIPRVVYTVVITAILIPVAFEVAANFISSLSNFMGIIGIWSAAWAAIVTMEHVVIRKGAASNYNVEDWNVPRALTTGLPAVGAALLSFGLAIPCMDKAWFTGSIAKKSGDLGFEIALILSAIFYVPLRFLEIRIRGRI